MLQATKSKLFDLYALSNNSIVSASIQSSESTKNKTSPEESSTALFLAADTPRCADFTTIILESFSAFWIHISLYP